MEKSNQGLKFANSMLYSYPFVLYNVYVPDRIQILEVCMRC